MQTYPKERQRKPIPILARDDYLNGMKLQRIFEKLSDLADKGTVPKGLLDEGRIFALGQFVNEDHLHSRVIDLIEGLGSHIGQPFEQHPWAFSFDISTVKQDGRTSPTTAVGVVWPRTNGSVIVKEYAAAPRGLRLHHQLLFEHLDSGTTAKAFDTSGNPKTGEDAITGSFYPLAIAMLNTRGCSIDARQAPTLLNAKRAKKGKQPIPAHYELDGSEYFTALCASQSNSRGEAGHASPLPHLRRAHERVLANGKRIWIPSALVNVRNEGDIAFVERRKAYKK